MREVEKGNDVRPEAILAMHGLKKRFRGNHVLRGVTGEIRKGSATALIGSNGAGKSTLINVISGILSSDEGTIVLDGIDITTKAGYARARTGIGRTFQHPRAFSSLSVLDIVLMASTPPSEEGIAKNLGRAFGLVKPRTNYEVDSARTIMELCRINHLANTTADQLSYGERKLLMLAQTLAFNRQLICLDEVCAGLEPSVIEYLMRVFADLVRKGKTILFVEHNLELVRELANDIVFLHEGKIYRSGKAKDVLTDPDVISLYLGE